MSEPLTKICDCADGTMCIEKHVSGIMWHNKESLDLLACQISKIKQEAKQEVFDDVEEISTSYYSGYLKGCRRYFISKFEEIKKKHGVE